MVRGSPTLTGKKKKKKSGKGQSEKVKKKKSGEGNVLCASYSRERDRQGRKGGTGEMITLLFTPRKVDDQRV